MFVEAPVIIPGRMNTLYSLFLSLCRAFKRQNNNITIIIIIIIGNHNMKEFCSNYIERCIRFRYICFHIRVVRSVAWWCATATSACLDLGRFRSGGVFTSLYSVLSSAAAFAEEALTESREPLCYTAKKQTKKTLKTEKEQVRVWTPERNALPCRLPQLRGNWTFRARQSSAQLCDEYMRAE